MINQDGVITTISVLKDVMDDPALIRKLLLRGWEIVGIDRFGCFYFHRKIELGVSMVYLLKFIKAYLKNNSLNNLKNITTCCMSLESFDKNVCDLFLAVQDLVDCSKSIITSEYKDKSLIDEFNDLINTKFKKYIYD